MGSGRDTHIGWAEESAWGTPQVPTKFSELVSESMLAVRTSTPRPVFNGLDIDSTELYEELDGGSGSFTVEGLYEGQLRLLEHALGDVATLADTPESGAHQHTFTPAAGELHAGVGLSFSVHKAFTTSLRLNGCKVRTLTMSFDPTRNAQFTFDVIAKDVMGATEASPTFTGNSLLVAGHQTTVEVGDSLIGVDLAEIIIANGLDDDKRILGDKNIDEPVRNDKRSITGTLTLDAEINAHVVAFLARTTFKLEIICTTIANIGATATPWSMVTTIPNCLITEDPVTVDGPGLVKATIPFMALKPVGADIMDIVVISGETAVA